MDNDTYNDIELLTLRSRKVKENQLVGLWVSLLVIANIAIWFGLAVPAMINYMK